MKIMIVHISDMHFTDRDTKSLNMAARIGTALQAIKKGETISAVYVLVTGDIAFSGKKEEYKIAIDFFNNLRKNIGCTTDIGYSKVKFIITPGNHDLNHAIGEYNKGMLDDVYINNCYNEFNNYECEKLSAYLDFQNEFFTEKCNFCESYIVQSIINLQDVILEFNCINTAAFSSTHVGQGYQFLSDKDIRKLQNNTTSDYVFTIMHHPYHWYNPNIRNKLKEILYSNSDMIFVGHEHYMMEENISASESNVHIFAAGELCNKGDWSRSEFFVGILDSENREYHSYQYKIYGVDSYACERPKRYFIPKNRLNKLGFSPLKEYVSNLFLDKDLKITNNILSYYVFPILENITPGNNTKTSDIGNIKIFLNLIEKKKRIMLLGRSRYGKTFLSRVIFKVMSEKRIVLLFDATEFSSNINYDRLIKGKFEEIYGEDKDKYSDFKSANAEGKVIIIDNVDVLYNNDLIYDLYEEIDKTFGYVIFTINQRIDLDINDYIKKDSIFKKFSQFQICPFLKNKRKQLVKNVVNIIQREHSDTSRTTTISDIYSILSLQQHMYLTEPYFIVMFIKAICNTGKTISVNNNIFNSVFVANLTVMISPHLKNEISVDKMHTLASKIAMYMHNKKRINITISDIEFVINQYNDNYGEELLVRKIVDILIASNILSYQYDKYFFTNLSYYSYYVALEVKRELANNNDKSFKEILKHSYMRVNADIILFVMYIAGNVDILTQLMESLDEYICNWKEYKIIATKFKHLDLSRPFLDKLDVKCVADIDRKNFSENADIAEKKDINEKNISITSNPYSDYHDVATFVDELVRVLSIVEIISRSLPSLEHIMERNIKEKCLLLLYTVPLKVYYRIAEYIDDNKETIVKDILKYHSLDYQYDMYVKISNHINMISTTILLSLLDITMRYATMANTCKHLDNRMLFDYEQDETYSMEHLSSILHRDKVDMFISEVERIKKLYKGNTLLNFLIKRIVRHFMLVSENVTTSEIDKLNDKYLDNDRIPNKEIIIRRLKNKK